MPGAKARKRVCLEAVQDVPEISRWGTPGASGGRFVSRAALALLAYAVSEVALEGEDVAEARGARGRIGKRVVLRTRREGAGEATGTAHAWRRRSHRYASSKKA